MRGGSILSLIVLSAAIFMGCEPKPQPINYGSDECAYCRMMITDAEFGSQIVNNQGRAYKFDSVECMAAYDLTEDGENFHSKWVPNFLDIDEWLKAEDAVYLHSETLRSPMGLFLSAYSNRESAEEMKEEYGGDIVDYETVKQIVEREWPSNGSGGRQMMNNK
jgi:copper chaperone NosL